MVRTTSATRRESHVLTASLSAGRLHASKALVLLGHGDAIRGLAVAAALLLTFAGILAPTLDPLTLSTVLFLSGAALALLAAAHRGDAPFMHTEPVATVGTAGDPQVFLQRERPLPKMLSELLQLNEPRAGSDAAHWSRLTHRMSHELRTPLNAVIGFSDLMSNEVFGPLGSAHYQEYARDINRSGRYLLKATEDALAITSLLTRNPLRARDPIASMPAALDDMCKFHAPELQASGVAFSCQSQSDCDIVGEPQTLRQILVNLLGEALEYAGTDGCISLTVQASSSEVGVTLVLEGPRAKSAGGADSFALILVRTLLQLSSGRLEEAHDGSRWSTTATFPRAAQSDFFSAV